MNRQSYDTKRKNNDFLHDTRIVTSQYQKLVIDAVTDKTYSEMAHIYALSAALGIAIYSYYPPQMNSELSSAFTRNVYGRKVRAGSRSVLSLMWTSVTVPQSPKDFHVNHFVPLVPQTTCVNIKPVIVTCTNATETPVFVKSPDAKSVDVSGIDISPVRTHASHEPEFVDLVQAVVVGQFKELRGALLGTGELRLADSHKHFETSKTEWIQMSEQQKTNLFKRYRKYVAKNSDLVVSSDGQSTVVAPRTNGLKPGPQRKRKINIKTTTVPKKKK